MPKAPPDKKATRRPDKAAPAKPVAKPAPVPARPVPKPAKVPPPPRVAFPKKNQQPTPAAFTARLPLALGKRFEAARSFLIKQKDVAEDVYFYGPSTGWALRYLLAGKPLCALLLHSGLPVAIVSMEAAACAAVEWQALSPVGQRAQKTAHGSPSLLWLDIPLAGTGAADFKMIVRAKLATMTS
ncbi:MAG TPA: hypothetical protein VF518_13475 [Polyangia bacterium]